MKTIPYNRDLEDNICFLKKLKTFLNFFVFSEKKSREDSNIKRSYEIKKKKKTCFQLHSIEE